MIINSSGLGSQTPTITPSSIWFRSHRQSLPISSSSYGFSLGFPSRKFFFPLTTATIDAKDKDPLYIHRASESDLPGTPLVIERTIEDDLETRLLKNVNTLELGSIPTLDDLVTSYPSASTAAKTSRKLKNVRSISSNASQVPSDPLPVFRYPLNTESAIKAIIEQNTLVFVVDKHADKDMIKNSFKRMFKIKAKKVNTSITPDGTKKAFIMLPSDSKALDVAKKIKIL